MSKKKSKRSPGAETIQIRVNKENDIIDPLVCSFPAGLPASLREASGTLAIEPPKFLWRQSNSGTSLIGKDNACVYTAELSQNELSSKRTKLCVGIFDKNTRTLTIHQAAAEGSVFALSQTVPLYKNEAANRRPNNLTGTEHRRALFEDFGSTKKQRALRSQEANKVNVENVVGAGTLMQGTFMEGLSESNRKAVEERRMHLENDDDNNPVVEDASAAATRAWRDSFLPRYEQKAESPDLVYSAKDMIGESAWNYVHRVVGGCLEKDDPVDALINGSSKLKSPETSLQDSRPHDEWNESVKHLVENIRLDGPSAEYQMVCSVVVNHFLTLFLRLNRRRFIPPVDDDRHKYYGVPAVIGRQFLRNFATEITWENGSIGYAMSKANRDRCCLFTLILYVMAEGGKTMKSRNIKAIADDLKLDLKDASHLLRLAGFNVQRKAGSTHLVVALGIPLTFPVMKRGGKRSR